MNELELKQTIKKMVDEIGLMTRIAKMAVENEQVIENRYLSEISYRSLNSAYKNINEIAKPALGDL